ncbi:hypothetical protein X946_5016 [Burkholderia sp. ABCPW 111]|nr:hypothetical protein X946_5016 [Burkholderia sp. ABCPW 111]
MGGVSGAGARGSVPEGCVTGVSVDAVVMRSISQKIFRGDEGVNRIRDFRMIC